MSLPLYDNLLKENINRDSINLTSDQREEFFDLVKTQNKMNREIMYALIKKHAIESGISSSHPLPYDAKQLKTGIQFSLDKLPNILQHILYGFLKLQQQ